MRFAIYKTGKGEYYFSVLRDDFKALCTSEPTQDKESVYHAIETIRAEASDASTLDFS